MRTLARLVMLLAAAAAPLSLAQTPSKSCADAVPKDCAKVKLLGEDGDCACFVCNPGTKARKVVCTRDEDAKKALYKLRGETDEKSDKTGKTPSSEGVR